MYALFVYAYGYMTYRCVGSSSISWLSSLSATTVVNSGNNQANGSSVYPPGNGSHNHHNNHHHSSNNNNPMNTLPNNLSQHPPPLRNELKIQSIHALQAAPSLNRTKMAPPVLLSSIPDATLTGVMQHRLFGGLLPSTIVESPSSPINESQQVKSSGDPPSDAILYISSHSIHSVTPSDVPYCPTLTLSVF